MPKSSQSSSSRIAGIAVDGKPRRSSTCGGGPCDQVASSSSSLVARRLVVVIVVVVLVVVVVVVIEVVDSSRLGRRSPRAPPERSLVAVTLVESSSQLARVARADVRSRRSSSVARRRRRRRPRRLVVVVACVGQARAGLEEPRGLDAQRAAPSIEPALRVDGVPGLRRRPRHRRRCASRSSRSSGSSSMNASASGNQRRDVAQHARPAPSRSTGRAQPHARGTRTRSRLRSGSRPWTATAISCPPGARASRGTAP